LHHGIEQPGIHRVEAALAKKPWIYSNPVYVRS
jgi:hypothetical protein